MSVDQHQSTLLACYQNSQDPVLQGAAEQANSYTEMLKGGQITKDEYLELMQDIQRQANINNSVHNQVVLEHMNVAINGLITLAKLI